MERLVQRQRAGVLVPGRKWYVMKVSEEGESTERLSPDWQAAHVEGTECPLTGIEGKFSPVKY